MTGSAKQSSLVPETMDCFIAEFIIGPAEGRTRCLLAMTGTVTWSEALMGFACVQPIYERRLTI
jgi:hypothetical protein